MPSDAHIANSKVRDAALQSLILLVYLVRVIPSTMKTICIYATRSNEEGFKTGHHTSGMGFLLTIWLDTLMMDR